MAIELAVALRVALALLPSPEQPDSLSHTRVVGPEGARLDSQLTRFAQYGFSGTVLVTRGGKIVLLKGYGLADVARGIGNSAATRFEMNSMTKMFTGVAILRLAGAGKLRPGDPVDRILGEFPPAKRGATIEQLASHTSGLIVEGANLAGESRDAFLRDVKQGPREAPPGQQYRYTNAGFSLLAAIIELASGQRYEDYLRQQVFAPAGLLTARFRDEVPATDTLFAHGYIGTPAGLEPGPPNPYVWGTRGAGGVWATVGDMYRWLAAVRAGKLLNAAEQQVLFAPARPPSLEAYGWHVNATTPEGRARIDKGGGSDDFASHMLYYPEDSVVIIWASNNLRQRWRQTLNRTLPSIVFGQAVLSLPPPIPLQRDALAHYAGRYNAGDSDIEFRAGDGYLYAVTRAADIPTGVMFFPQDITNFTAYDPATRGITRLKFSLTPGRSVVIELSDGRRIPARG